MPKQRLEIDCQEVLNRDMAVMVDHHSLLNLLNVLERELEGLINRLEEAALKPYSAFCVSILMALSDPVTEKEISPIEERFDALAEELRRLLKSTPQEAEAIRGLFEVLEVASVRLGEFRDDRFAWKRIPCEDFHKRLGQFLSATERVSRGRFHFVYSPKEPSQSGYQIDFQIKSSSDFLFAPYVLQDTVRDLVGNARKYSPPGTRIRIRLQEENPDGLRLQISDQGMGIPENEIADVVRFGFRASNAQDLKTMGGGFGLTKAYQLCKKFHGRFFIDSAPGEGTTIEMTLFPPP